MVYPGDTAAGTDRPKRTLRRLLTLFEIVIGTMPATLIWINFGGWRRSIERRSLTSDLASALQGRRKSPAKPDR